MSQVWGDIIRHHKAGTCLTKTSSCFHLKSQIIVNGDTREHRKLECSDETIKRCHALDDGIYYNPKYNDLLVYLNLISFLF